MGLNITVQSNGSIDGSYVKNTILNATSDIIIESTKNAMIVGQVGMIYANKKITFTSGSIIGKGTAATTQYILMQSKDNI